MEKNLSKKILNATKWSGITEIIAKLIVPVTNMILARILSPEAFGVVATITMIISFVDMFTDAGFQKYLIQHEFVDEEEREISINVAFWTNLTISIIIWCIIIIFSQNIAKSVGNAGLGNVISIACIQLPLTSFSSIQMAIYRRDFDFKTLFLVRLVGIFIPFLVTIPLAMLGYSYWSLIIGSICGTFSNAVILTWKSTWKPKFRYKYSILKKMFSFSMWSLIEAISIWLTTWIDTFIIGSVLNNYYLGLYKTSLTAVNGIFGLVTSATTPILFSALSRAQDDDKKFNNIFFNMQRIVSYLLIPMSVGMFVFGDTVVDILLGDNWKEANEVVSIWALVSGLVIVLGHYSSEVYRAKGKPKLSFFAQMLNLIVLVPVCIAGSKFDFLTLVKLRAFVRLELVIVDLLFMQFILKISVNTMIKNIKIPIICSFIMGICAIGLSKIFENLYGNIISIVLCIIIYVLLLACFPKSRNDLIIVLKKFKITTKSKIENTI